jgi:hypothetical protein
VNKLSATPSGGEGNGRLAVRVGLSTRFIVANPFGVHFFTIGYEVKYQPVVRVAHLHY